MTANALTHDLKVVLNADRMRAFLCLSHGGECSDLAVEDVIRTLQAARIQITPRVRERVDEFVTSVRSGAIPPERFLVAEGSGPTEPQGAQFVFADTPAPSADTGVGRYCGGQPEPADGGDERVGNDLDRIDLFESTHIRTTEADHVLGYLTPAAPGKPGVDVCGRSVPPRRAPVEIELGENVALASDGRTVRAAASGMVHWTGRRLSVLTVVEIAGDVDFESGSVEAPTDVLIRGEIKDSFHVRSSGHIAVGGAIGACDVTAGGNIQVSGGIAGKDKARLEAQGQVIAKFCDACFVRAAGDLIIATEAINSRLYTRGRIRMPRGTLIGGYTYARCGGEVKILGSDAGIKTSIAMGVDPEAFDRCDEIDDEIVRRRKTAARIRQTVGPLLDQMKHLLPTQRERATELLYEADQVEVVVQGLLKQKEDIIKKTAPDEPPALSVSSLIWPGVTVIIGDLMTTFLDEQKGPVRIMRRQGDRGEEIVCVSAITGNVTTLPSRDSRQKTKA